MSDENQQNQGTGGDDAVVAASADAKTTGAGTTAGAAQGTQVTYAEDGMQIDRNKSAEQYIEDAKAMYIVPSLVREEFPDLIKLIYETESMNEEERQYWLQIMPIMTEDQISKFRAILVNEKEQLEKLDAEYAGEVGKMAKAQPKPIDEAKMKERMQELSKAEASNEEAEKAEEDALLKQLEGM